VTTITIDNYGSFIEGEAHVTIYYPTPKSFLLGADSTNWGYGNGWIALTPRLEFAVPQLFFSSVATAVASRRRSRSARLQTQRAAPGAARRSVAEPGCCRCCLRS
jgi:hypothetical protein